MIQSCSTPRLFALVLATLLVGQGCSIKRTAANIAGDALSGEGGVYSSDNDPDLVREALPFGLKTYESLLAITPEHQGLLLASANGFIAYAYLLNQQADFMEATNLAGARDLRARVSQLYLRGRDYALRGLEVSHPGFTAKLAQDVSAALAMTDKDDVAFLYWAGAGWAGALGADKGNAKLIAELPTAGALLIRVTQVDVMFDRGSADELLITYEGSRPGGSSAAARQHYQRALELSKGERASVYLALAESVSVKEQNLVEFRQLVHLALAVDPDRVPELRLVNTVAIRRAHWLDQRTPDLFVNASPTE